MKVLYFTVPFQDYLSDSLLIGLKQLDDVEVNDFPENRFIYKVDDETFEKKQSNLYGNGFTVYNCLSDEYKTNKNFIQLHNSSLKDYDLIVFSSIWSQLGIFMKYYDFLDTDKTIIVDGHDAQAIFPYHGNFLRKQRNWLLPKPHRKFKYLKRELTPESVHSIYYKLLPRFISKHKKISDNIIPTSFGIPEEKIVKNIPLKEKLFPVHIVDKEVAAKVNKGQTNYAFNKESDYYADIQKSKFGVTTKKAGWDCMRHYEIAANGTVICFKNLNKKPINCAPHGLVIGENCLSYRNYNDLMAQISGLSESSYKTLQANTIKWVNEYTCKKVAQRVLAEINCI